MNCSSATQNNEYKPNCVHILLETSSEDILVRYTIQTLVEVYEQRRSIDNSIIYLVVIGF